MLEQLNETLLKDKKLVFSNVKPETILSFRIIVEEEKGSPSKKASSTSTIGMSSILVSSLGLVSWEAKESALTIAGYKATFNSRLLFSEFTKNSKKIINLTFHRLMCLYTHEMVDNIKEAKLIGNKSG